MAFDSAYHWMYKTKAWLERRAWQLRHAPLCECCRDSLGRTTPAIVAHHVTPHQGSWELFIMGPLASLCKECHDSMAQSEERLGYSKACDVNGKPIDARHPSMAPVFAGRSKA